MGKKKKDCKKILKIIKRLIFSQKFLESRRKSKKDFTRDRKLPFPKLILFMLNLVKQSLQKELTQFFLKYSNEKNITTIQHL